MKDDLEYHLDDPGDNIEIEKANSKNKKVKNVLISIAIIEFIIIVIGIILFLTLGKKDSNKEKDSYKEQDSNKEQDFPEVYLYINISTSENNMIKNSFKKGGENYKPEIGNLNNGNDYKENERDNFDLCIPKSVFQNKTNYQTIVLNIHGGGWMGGKKANVLETYKSGLFKNFILASMSYTILNGNYKE